MSTLELRADLKPGPAPWALMHTPSLREPDRRRSQDTLLWPAAELDRALQLLGRSARVTGIGPDEQPPASLGRLGAGAEVGGWQPTEADLAQLAGRDDPAVVPTSDGTHFALLTGRRGRHFAVLLPDGRVVTRDLRHLADALGGPAAPIPYASLELPARLARRLATDAARPSIPCYRLRPAVAPRLSRELVAAGVSAQVLILLALLIVARLAEIGGWGLFGGAVLGGTDGTWGILGWLLLLASLNLLGMPIQRTQSEIVLRVSLLLKRRMMRGALGLELDVLRRIGPSGLTSRTQEAQALEQSGLAAVLGGLAAVVELVFAGMLSLAGAAGGLQLLWLVLLSSLIAAATIPCRFALLRWSRERREQARQLVEAIAGHRTTRLQMHPERRRRQLDTGLSGYLAMARTADARARLLLVSLPSLWTIGALGCLLPVSLAGGLEATGLAITVGATLLGARAVNALVGSIAAGLRAEVAFAQLGELLEAASRPVAVGRPAVLRGHGDAIRASGLVYCHAGRTRPTLSGVDLAISPGERLLVTGASGGGKSTLGAVLVGLRSPQAGQLAFPSGGDRPAAMAAPQFHENHVFSATLAENLYPAHMGPLSAAMEADARALLDRLGLGPLVERMPMGLMQRLGSGGLALSQGERSRICLARAVLADADLLVLDESFGALDPHSARQCLGAVRASARALVVIAHP